MPGVLVHNNKAQLNLRVKRAKLKSGKNVVNIKPRANLSFLCSSFFFLQLLYDMSFGFHRSLLMQFHS